MYILGDCRFCTLSANPMVAKISEDIDLSDEETNKGPAAVAVQRAQDYESF